MINDLIDLLVIALSMLLYYAIGYFIFKKSSEHYKICKFVLPYYDAYIQREHLDRAIYIKERKHQTVFYLLVGIVGIVIGLSFLMNSIKTGMYWIQSIAFIVGAFCGAYFDIGEKARNSFSGRMIRVYQIDIGAYPEKREELNAVLNERLDKRIKQEPQETGPDLSDETSESSDLDSNGFASKAHRFNNKLGIIGTVAVVLATLYHVYVCYYAWENLGAIWGIISIVTPPISDLVVSGVMLFDGVWQPPLIAIISGSILYYIGD